MSEASDIIALLGLQPHPEGGYFRETYRCERLMECKGDAGGYPDGRSVSTAVYFLLQGDDFSALHRIRSDEIWHFYRGSGLTVCSIDEQGALTRTRLGADIQGGETSQLVVKAGCWFGAHLDDASSYALVGCTVAPGFDFRDFELGERSRLLAAFPQHADIIARLTR
jgi:predicted cupin superfamily sugar epimerase